MLRTIIDPIRPVGSSVVSRFVAFMTLLFVMGSVLASAASPASAAVTCDRVASPSGSDGNSGSVTSPYLTVQKLDGSLSSGQTGCLRAGKYASGVQTTFSTPNVTITSYPGERATVAGFPYINGSGTTLSYVDVDLNKTGDPWPALCQGAISGGASVTYDLLIAANNVTITHDNIYVDPSIPMTQRGLGIGDGFGVHTASSVISYNRIHDVGFCPVEEHAIYIDDTTGTQVFGNWIYNIPAGTGIQVWDHAHSNDIHSNVIDGTSSCVDIGSNTNDSTGNTAEHNICSNTVGVQAPYASYCNSPGPGCTGPATGSPLFDYWGGGAGAGNSFTNNDLWCVSTAHCTTSTAGSSGVALSGNITTNPQFADPNYQTSHDYRVASSSPAASWGLWNGDIGTTTTPPPATAAAMPTAVTATAGTSQVTVQWAANASGDKVTSYSVYRTDQAAEWATSTSNSFVNTGSIVNGTQYCYQITASNSTGESAKTAAVCATPKAPAPVLAVAAVPTGMTATAGNGQVALNWAANASTDLVTHYNVYRTDQTFSGAWATPTTTTFTNAGSIVNGTQYCYQITATNSVGESAKTAPVCATPKVPVPTVAAVPTGITATAGTGQVTLKWAANASGDQVTHYNIYRTDQTFAGAWATPTTTTFTNTSSIVHGTRYCYQITATNNLGESAKSAAVCVTP
jgi:hypothetical protein